MAIEIERKFIVRSDAWRDRAHAHCDYAQGYLCGEGPASVRVRVEGERANLNVKAATIGRARAEYQYDVPLDDAREMLEQLCVAPPLTKTRHWVNHGNHTWEIDVFGGANAPLVVAEIELSREDETFERPPWLGEEVTHDRRYYNHALSITPYEQWAR